MSRRPKWWMRVEGWGSIKDDWQPVGVFDLCEMVHMHCTGSFDQDFTDIKLAVRCLKWLDKNWEDSTSDYDAAVRTLVTATLSEFHEWKMDQRSERDAERAA